MHWKKSIILMLLLIAAICAISQASAADNLTDTITETNDDSALKTNADESILAHDQSDEILSASNTPSTYYSVDLRDTYEISSSKSGSVTVYINPCKSTSYNAYNFWLVGFDKDYNVVYNSSLKSSTTSSNRVAKDHTYTISANSFLPGTYHLAAVNDGDYKVMDRAILKVKGTATITAGDFSAYYGSGKTMTAKVTDSATGKPLNGIDVKVTFTAGKKTQTRNYISDANGIVKITPPAAVGTYSVSITSTTGHVSSTTIKKTAKINRAPVSIKAYRVSEYKGFKVTLKATVKSQGKKVNEGTVTFKINGKTYKVKVKNGVASKKLKLKKVKKYTYSAKFSSSNYKKSKTVKSKATIKKRLPTKIAVKNQKVYMNDAKIFTMKVLTKSGKKVKDGKLKIKGVGTVEVKNGKVKVVKYGLGIKHLKRISGRSEYYKKHVSKTFKVKYVPSSHKYLPSTKKVKITSVFKCPGCGKTSTHNHYAVGYYVVYKTRIIVS